MSKKVTIEIDERMESALSYASLTLFEEKVKLEAVLKEMYDNSDYQPEEYLLKDVKKSIAYLGESIEFIAEII